MFKKHYTWAGSSRGIEWSRGCLCLVAWTLNASVASRCTQCPPKMTLFLFNYSLFGKSEISKILIQKARILGFLDNLVQENRESISHSSQISSWMDQKIIQEYVTTFVFCDELGSVKHWRVIRCELCFKFPIIGFDQDNWKSWSKFPVHSILGQLPAEFSCDMLWLLLLSPSHSSFCSPS